MAEATVSAVVVEWPPACGKWIWYFGDKVAEWIGIPVGKVVKLFLHH